jgi:hypothetical protein
MTIRKIVSKKNRPEPSAEELAAREPPPRVGSQSCCQCSQLDLTGRSHRELARNTSELSSLGWCGLVYPIVDATRWEIDSYEPGGQDCGVGDRNSGWR